MVFAEVVEDVEDAEEEAALGEMIRMEVKGIEVEGEAEAEVEEVGEEGEVVSREVIIDQLKW